MNNKVEDKMNNKVDSSSSNNLEDSSNNKPKMGGRREGAGRPVGARSRRPSRVEIDAHGSIKKLEALGFDPIEAHIKAIEEIDIRLDKEDKKRKPSSMAVSQLLSIKEKHVSSLMRYGYRQVPEKTEVETAVPAFGVSLSFNSPSPSPSLEETLEDKDITKYSLDPLPLDPSKDLPENSKELVEKEKENADD